MRSKKVSSSCLVYCTVLIFSLNFNIAFGQGPRLIGRYIADDNFVEISDSTLEFMTSYGCCLTQDIYGYGKYRITNDSIYVTTGKPPSGHGSSYQILNNLPTTEKISIQVQSNGMPVHGCNVILSDKITSKLLQGTFSDISGLALIDSLPKESIETKIVSINMMGYDPIEMPLTEVSGKSILVHLADYRVVRDRQVVFRLFSDSISLRLIGPFFQLTNQEKKEEKKLKRKRNFRTLVHAWPWHWRFRDTHIAKPLEFVR